MTEKRRILILGLCLMAAVAIVYSPVRHSVFVDFDDQDYVGSNPHAQNGLTLRGLAWAFTTNHTGNWHPLTWLSHMLDWQLWGDNAGAHHLVNVLLHVANTVLLFWVLRRMTASPWRSALVAGLFALHPLHVESVAWVSERKDVLSACFWMLTIWAYVRYVEQPSRSRYISTLGLYALGLMAKPMVVTLPFVLLLVDYWPLGRTRWANPPAGERVKTSPGQLFKEKLPFSALAVASSIVTYWAQRQGETVVSLANLPLGLRIGNALLSYVGYIGRMFWPMGLAVFYPMPASLSAVAVMGAAVGLAGMTLVAIWRARHGEPWFATGWLWYLGTLVPVIGLVQVGGQSMADRYTYIPLVGFFLVLAWCVPAHAMERQIVKVIACVLAGTGLAVCAALSRVQVGYWKNSETLFRHALDVTKDNWLAHYCLGVAYGQAGKYADAAEQHEQVLQLKPNNVQAHYNLAGALARLGRLPEAIQHWEAALRIKPDYAEAHHSLGVALAQLGREQEARGHFEQALRIKPDYAEAHYDLGISLAMEGRLPEAVDHWEQALRIKPDFPEARNKLARLRLVQ